MWFKNRVAFQDRRLTAENSSSGRFLVPRSMIVTGIDLAGAKISRHFDHESTRILRLCLQLLGV
jgi:hypothetical protein